jgi:MFS family permease
MTDSTLARPLLTIATLLFASCLTVMAGAIIAPSLPGIAEHFATNANANLLARLILVVPALTIVVAAPLAGWAADRFGPRSVLLWSAFVFVVGGTSGALLSGLEAIVAGRALLGVGVAGLMVGATTAVGTLFPPANRSALLGYQGAAAAAGGVVFLILGGVLAEMSWRYPFMIYAAALLILPLVLITIPKTEMRTAASELSALPYAKFLPVYLMGFVVMLGFYLIPGQTPFLVKEQSLSSTTGSGIAIASSTLTTAIVATFYARISHLLARHTLFALTFILLAVGLLFASYASSLLLLIIALSITGIGMGLFQPTAMTWLFEMVSQDQRGRATSGLTSSLFLGQFCSAFIVSIVPTHTALAAFRSMGYVLIGLTLVTVAIVLTRRARVRATL